MLLEDVKMVALPEASTTGLGTLVNYTDKTDLSNTTNSTAENQTVDPLCLLNKYCLNDEDYLTELSNEYIFPEDPEWVLISVYILTFLVGLIGNSFVCFAIWRNRNMRTVTNIFIVNLSVADLAVILICLPSTLVVDVTETWFMGRAFCKIHACLMTISLSVSVLTLSAISVERWYAICHPLRFHSTVRRARIIIISIWVLSCIIAIPEMISVDTEEWRPDTVLFTSCYMVLWEEKQVVIFQVFLMLALYFIPIFLMGFTYTKIAIVLWTERVPGAVERNRSRQRQPMMDNHSGEPDEQTESRRKAAKMLVAVVVVFGLCFLPVHMYNIFRYTGVLDMLDDTHTNVFALITHWAAFFNSCINPVIYNFMSDKFRKEFKMACFLCVRCGRRNARLTRSDMYRMTYNSARTFSSRYNSNYNGHSNTENISMSSVTRQPNV